MRLLLVDLDNTLGDRTGAFAQWATEFVQTHGFDGEALRVVHEADRDGLAPRSAFFAEVCDRLGLSIDVETLVARYATEYTRHYRAFPGVPDALGGLRGEGWRIAVVTNGSWWQRDKIRIAGLTGVIDACCISGEVGVRKPDPKILEVAAEMCGLPLEGAWMVGDSLVDIQAAHAAGIRSAWIDHGRRWPEAAFAPTRIVESFVDATAAIGGLNITTPNPARADGALGPGH